MPRSSGSADIAGSRKVEPHTHRFEGPFYHGGARRLDRVGLILPPAKTGAHSLADYGGAGVTRRDRVYVTTDPAAAELYALMAPPKGRGDVYEVEPIGDLERDPDYIPAECESFQCPMARIVRVVRRNVTTFQGLTMSEAAAILTPDGDTYAVGNRRAAA